MIKPGAVLVAHLKSVPAVTAIAGTRIFASKYLPSGFKVENGGALLLQPRGGLIHYSGKALAPSMQIRAYGRNELEAESLMGVVCDALINHTGGAIIGCTLEGIPTPLRDPETGWDYQLGYFTIYLRFQEA